jgi:hypothetical protein
MNKKANESLGNVSMRTKQGKVDLKLMSVSVYRRQKYKSSRLQRNIFRTVKNSEQCTAEEITIVKNIYSFPFTSK